MVEKWLNLFPGPVMLPQVRRLRDIIAALLPSLWLVVMMNCSCETAGIVAADCSNNAAGVSEQGDGGSRHECCFIKQTARQASRRASERFGADSVSAKVAPPGDSVSEQTVAYTSCAVAEMPLCLAKSWQFDWRAAPEPRAPSFLS